VNVICVVGAGPRGLSVVERLCANASLSPEPVVIHLVDPFLGRGGRVWTTEQSPLLLMNTIASQVTMFTDDSVDCEGPVVRGPSLYEWARTLDVPLGPDDYPTRALFGYYLNWVLRRLHAAAPPGVTIIEHRRRAVAVEDEAIGFGQVVTLDDGHRLTGLSAVVLAQGHVDMPADDEERRLARFAAERGLTYLPRANPAESDLSRITGSDVVAIRGMGLNFFDYVALLTAGRGGRFERAGRRLRYRRSGREPLLYAGSRRGVPYHARGENEKGAFGRHEPRFITPEVIDRLRAGPPASFRSEVWPLIAREVESVHGSAFDWERIASPHGGRVFRSAARYRDWLLDYLRADHESARGGNVSNPLKAALDVLRDLRNEIRLIVDHGGLTGSSYRGELESWYTPLNAYLSIGPPASRIEELIALVEAGVLSVVGPGMRLDLTGNRFRIGSPMVHGSAVDATAFIDARLPETDVRRTTDPLLARLRATGGCVPFAIPDAAGHHETGGLAVTSRPYRIIDAHGRAHPRRFGYGVPTEGVHWVTAAGIRPGVNSVILSDADAIARSALTADLDSLADPVARLA
jgi:L-aspartate N-monooxygenase (nitrosuccinate-forming)